MIKQLPLAFLIVAPLPLLAHLGHPERSFEIFVTPQPKSAMAMFGFVYTWYLMMALLVTPFVLLWIMVKIMPAWQDKPPSGVDTGQLQVD